jgi:hypothetical protein
MRHRQRNRPQTRRSLEHDTASAHTLEQVMPPTNSNCSPWDRSFRVRGMEFVQPSHLSGSCADRRHQTGQQPAADMGPRGGRLRQAFRCFICRPGDRQHDGASRFPVTAQARPALFSSWPRQFWETRWRLSRLWVTRRDDGTRTANVSEIVGTGVAAGISRIYYPSVDRTAAKTLGNWGIQLGVAAGWNEFYEFWPDIRHAIFRK